MYGIDGHPYSYFALTCCQISNAKGATATAAIAHEIKQPPLANFALQKNNRPFRSTVIAGNHERHADRLVVIARKPLMR